MYIYISNSIIYTYANTYLFMLKHLQIEYTTAQSLGSLRFFLENN